MTGSGYSHHTIVLFGVLRSWTTEHDLSYCLDAEQFPPAGGTKEMMLDHDHAHRWAQPMITVRDGGY